MVQVRGHTTRHRHTVVLPASCRRTDFEVSVEDLCVSAHGFAGQPDVEILQEVNLTIESGRVLAILGSSGAGKTTLLNMLVHDLGHNLEYSGRLTYNDTDLSRRMFQAVGSYVEQVDALWPVLTVRETMHFAVNLYQGRMSAKWKQAKVNETLKDTGLANCQHVVVGDGTLVRGISGGQKKRLSIAIELMKSPSLLVLDEPTSGLDSAAAEAIVELLVRYAQEQNIGVACTVHQPSSYVFKLFDNLLVLAAGRVCYFGKASGALKHFEQIGHKCEAGVNPAEFILRKTNSDFTSSQEVDRICDAWSGYAAALPQGSQCLNWIPASSSFASLSPSSCSSSSSSSMPSSGDGATCLQRVWLLAHRAALGHLRNPAAVLGRILFGSMGIAVISIAYWQARNRNQEDVLDRIWVVMWLQQLPAFLVIGTIPTFALESLCLRKEMRNGMFGALSYLLGDFVVSVPLWFIIVFLSIVPGFAILDLNWVNFPRVWLLISCYVGLFHTMAQVCCVCFSSLAVATVAFIFQTILNMIFNGAMLTRVESVTWALRWVAYIVPSKYSFRSGVFLEFEGLAFSGFEQCSNPAMPIMQRLGLPCWGTEGQDVLATLKKNTFPVLTASNQLAVDLGVILAWILLLKLVHAGALLRK